MKSKAWADRPQAGGYRDKARHGTGKLKPWRCSHGPVGRLPICNSARDETGTGRWLQETVGTPERRYSLQNQHRRLTLEKINVNYLSAL